MDLASIPFGDVQARVDAALGEGEQREHDLQSLVDDLRRQLEAERATLPSFILGWTQPSPDNVGSHLDEYEPWNDPATQKVELNNGTDLEGVTIYGDIVLPEEVRLVNCHLPGGPHQPGADTAILTAPSHDGTGRRYIQNCDILATTPAPGRNGIRGGHHLDVTNCRIGNVVDGISVFPTGPDKDAELGAHFVGNLIEALAAFYPDPLHNRPVTHNDGIVLENGRDIEVRGNYVTGKAYAAAGTATDSIAAGYCGQGVLVCGVHDPSVRVVENWIGGAKQQAMFKAGTSLTYSGNRHLRDTYLSRTTPKWAGYWMRVEDQATVQLYGGDNVWADGPLAGQALTTANRGIVYNTKVA